MHHETQDAHRAFPWALSALHERRWVFVALCMTLPAGAGCVGETHDLGGHAAGAPSSLGPKGALSNVEGGGFAAASGVDGGGAEGGPRGASGEGVVSGGTGGGDAVTSGTGGVAAAGVGAGGGWGPVGGGIGGGASVRECGLLTEQECLEGAGCKPVIDAAGAFWECLPTEASCPPESACASDGRRVAAFGGCTPTGWFTIAVPSCAAEARCSTLTTPEDCESASGCKAVSSADGADLIFYCTSASSCGTQETCARYLDDTVVRRFQTACLPPGWQPVEGGCGL